MRDACKGGGRAVGYAALGLVGVLVATGCADQAGASGGGGEGVAFGASMEEYQAAFAGIDPITLVTQTPAPKGSVTGSYMERYLEAVTEWSDGKITFEVSYSNAIAPPAEIDDALVDGRMDLGLVLPIYEPAEYPANVALIESSFSSDHSVVTGAMQHNTWPLEVAYDTPEIMAEFSDNGMNLIMPFYTSGSNGVLCSEPRRDLDSFDGAQVSVGGSAGNKEMAALGASPTSVAYTELYESLQRGVIDCSLTSLNVAALAGIIPEAPHVTLDPEVGFALAPGAMAVSQATWDSLPLAARQLLYDRLDVFFQANIVDKIWASTAEASQQIQEAGGSVESFDDAARAELREANGALLEEVRANPALEDGEAFVERVQAASDRWSRILEEDFDFDDEVDYNGFGEWYSPDRLDISDYTQRVFEEIFLEHRPS